MSLKAIFYPDVQFDTLFIPHIYKEIFFDKVYADVCNRKDLIMIDIGANIGIVSSFLRDYCSKLYAIEPCARHFNALQKNKEFNKWDNVDIFNCAIADIDGEMNLSINSGNQTMNSLSTAPIFNTGISELVKTMRLDTFFANNQIDHVDFVKFDVEGAEEMILMSEGFKNIASKINAIEVEFHFSDYIKLVTYMEGLGFKSKHIPADAKIVLFRR